MSNDAEFLLTIPNKSKRIDNFYVKFYNVPENYSNVLGRQVKAITRPSLRFSQFEQRQRQSIQKAKGKIEFDEITITFKDDAESITSMILYAQIMRQANRHSDIFGQNDGGKERNYKFDLEVEMYDPTGTRVVEGYKLSECWIMSIDHSDPLMSDSSENEITVVLNFDNIDIYVFDRYLKLKEALSNED